MREIIQGAALLMAFTCVFVFAKPTYAQGGDVVTVTTKDGKVVPVVNFQAVYSLSMRIAFGEIPTDSASALYLVLFPKTENKQPSKPERLILPFSNLSLVTFEKPGTYNGPCGKEFAPYLIWHIVRDNGSKIRLSSECFAEFTPTNESLRVVKLDIFNSRNIQRGGPYGYEFALKEMPVTTLPERRVENRPMLFNHFKGRVVKPTGESNSVMFFIDEKLRIEFPTRRIKRPNSRELTRLFPRQVESERVRLSRSSADW
ncbi:MAG: hypothetical protein AABM67_06600 [Acidobacteriota bacterium]